MAAWLWLVSMAALLAIWVGPAWRPRPLAGVERRRPWAIGHRGVRGPAPENTLEAFRMALEAGLDGLETDVQRSKDGVLVLTHDLDVGGRPVVELTTDELRAAIPGLATLDELVELVRAYPGTLLNVELKSLGWRDGGLARAAARTFAASGLVDRLVVSSFSPVALLRFRRWAPEVRTGYLWIVRPDVPWLLRSPWPAALLHVDALHPHHREVAAAVVAGWQRRGLLVQAWTVNEPDEVARVVAAGVDGVMADRPWELLRSLGRPTP